MRRYLGLRWLSLVCGVALAIHASDARAAGGEQNQGVLFAGTGIDWERSGTDAQLVPPSSVPHVFPPKSGDNVLLNGVKIHVNSCSGGNSEYSLCDVMASLSPGQPSSMLCGSWLSAYGGPVNLSLYAIKATVKRNGYIDFLSSSNPQTFTFACGTVKLPQDVTDADWNALGAMGKCLLWPRPPFMPNPSPAGYLLAPTPSGYGYPPRSANYGEFQACVRAARADYCGDGVTHTKDTTVIDLYPVPVPPNPAHDPAPAFLLEANWDEWGAICVVHARYVSLPDDCKKKLSCTFGSRVQKPDGGVVTQYIGTEYHCTRPGTGGAGSPPPKGRPPPRECPRGEPCKLLDTLNELLNTGVLTDDSLLQP
jgi:hypothetical protein